ncbi:MAG: hypothetical protein V9G12_08745 [Microthrixaceae bacterium]
MWNDARVLVYVLSAADTAATFEVCAATAPLTGNDHTVVVPEDHSPVTGAVVHVWADVQARLPQRAFDQRLGSAPDLLGRVAAATITPTGSFPPIAGDLDPRREELARLEDDLATVASARWQSEVPVRLRDLISGIRPSSLAKATGLEPGDADQVLDGRRELTPAQIDSVARTFNVPAPAVAAAASPVIDDEVVALFDQPARTRKLRTRAAASRRTVPEEMYAVALPLMQQAARTTGHEDRNWEALIDDALSD